MPSACLIDQFLKRYESEEHQNHYSKLADHISKLCREWLSPKGEKGVQANVTCRVKATNRLREKLESRERIRGRDYRSEKEIWDDIVDLVGVRIALFFPSDRKPVCKTIGERLFIEKVVEHPKPVHPKPIGGESQTDQRKGKARLEWSSMNYQDDDTALEYDRKFQGYQATHLWARFYDGRRPLWCPEGQDKVEIQIMTVLQSAWSEVEHDILYKHLHGKPSDLECQMLDSLNGLVSIGEMYLNQLSTVREFRIHSDDDKTKRFHNEYELGAFLFSEIAELRRDQLTSPSLELLRKFLGLSCVDADTKHLLGKELSKSRVEIERALQCDLLPNRKEKENMARIITRSIYLRRGLSVKACEIQPSTPLEKCGILISTVISLHDLFPPTSTWANELTGSGGKEQGLRPAQRGTRSDLKWLISAQTPKSVVLRELQELHASESAKIERLWKWFSEHDSDIVDFVFGISKLGVARDLPEDLETLGQIRCSVERRLLEP